MQKLIILFLFLGSCVYAQGNLDIRAGYLGPKDTKNSMMFGVSFGNSFDEAVKIGIGADFYHKSYSKMSKVAIEEGKLTEIRTEQKLVDYSRTIIPINLDIRVKIPAAQVYNFGYFVRGGLSYQLLWSQEKNYEDDSKDMRRFGGLGWQAGAGVYYQIGSRSTAYAGALYNSCEVSRDMSRGEKSLPIAQYVDLSGFGFQIGVELDLQ
ncbi:MAG: hypothetical protein U5R06_16485 [candidate division KSB1 bacterium]|nr:hypothetical protein [candidate division KSB1 bacterium]